MRIIASTTLATYAKKHPDATKSLAHWRNVARISEWASTNEVQRTFPKAKVLNGERVRFDVSGGDYRLIVSFDFRRKIAFIKFIGTHAEHDRIDALTISQFQEAADGNPPHPHRRRSCRRRAPN